MWNQSYLWMSTKFLSKNVKPLLCFNYRISMNSKHCSKFLKNGGCLFSKFNGKTESGGHSLLYLGLNMRKRRQFHSNGEDSEYSKTVPNYIYIQNPVYYLMAKFRLLRLKLIWDKDFTEEDFLFGTKQAVAAITEHIRTQRLDKIKTFTTKFGFQQIARDMLFSRNDPRLKLIYFRRKDIKEAFLTNVKLFKEDRSVCLINMFFVGMRNIQDFDDSIEDTIAKQLIRKYNAGQQEHEVITYSRFQIKFLRAEIQTQFFCDYTKRISPDWLISFYKIKSFEILSSP